LEENDILMPSWIARRELESGDPEAPRRILLLEILSVVAVVAMSLFGASNLVGGAWGLGLVLIVIGWSFPLVILRARITGDPTFASRYSTAILGALFLYFIFFEGKDHAMWAFILPLVSLFFLGHRTGMIVNILFMASVLVFFLLDPPEPFHTYDPSFQARFLGAFPTVSLVAYFFERTRAQFQVAAAEKNTDLQRTLSDLEKTAEALKESEGKYRDVVERASDGIVIVKDRRICFANSQIARISGYTTEELVGKDFVEFIHPDHLEKTLGYYVNRLDGKPTRKIYDSALRNQNGDPVAVEINSGLVTFEGSTAVLALVRDITRRRQAEREKEQLEEQLRQAQKMEAVGELAGGIAHDFNNMLSAISGFSQMILRHIGTGDPVLSDYARTIQETSTRAAELTAKLLAFARKGRFEVTPVNIHDAIHDVVKLLERTIDPRIRIARELKCSHPVVLGDRGQLQNAILNLAVNARDAMPSGGVLRFSTSDDTGADAPGKPESETGEFVIVQVTDTGTGMDPETKDRVFEPFFTTKDIGKGTGLGLASVYGTVKAHRGSIDVKSALEQGCTFTLRLPKAREAAGIVSEHCGAVETGTGRILVIDDEAPVREIYTAMLTEIGFEVVCAEDGRKGLDYFREHHAKIDLAIVDLMMPRLGGLECIEGLKIIDPDVPAIVSSGYAMNDEANRVLAAGARAFVQKPFTLEELARTVTSHLKVRPEQATTG
jgi:PAS domain S-box-containing protein